MSVGFRALVGNGTIERHVIGFTCTNTGKRSLVLTHVGGTPNDEKTGFLVNDNQIPHRLEPGDYHIAILRDYQSLNKGVRELFAMDSVGRKFKASQAECTEVNKRLRELAAKGIERSSVEAGEAGSAISC